MTLRRIAGGEVPNAVWPSDNEYGIPTLRLDRQAQLLDLPLTRWGRASRKARMRGTWHFYTEDHRFSRLWSRPQDLVNSAAVAAVEPNFSVHAQTPFAAALWQVYRKRWLARFWQHEGLAIWADLYVSDPFGPLNLAGVPRGWRAFATRGSSRAVADLEAEVAMAEAHTGVEPMVLVYGGPGAVREVCRARGWVYVQEEAGS